MCCRVLGSLKYLLALSGPVPGASGRSPPPFLPLLTHFCPLFHIGCAISVLLLLASCHSVLCFAGSGVSSPL